MRQYERAREEGFCLAFAREVVRAKVENCLGVARRFQANHPGRLSSSDLSSLQQSLELIPRAESLPALLGTEGTAASTYFRLLREMVPRPLRPERRSRRPPRDPFNALLSFGYVLVGNELQALLDAMGFDPYLGFYHQLDYGRPSLALDLLEEFRPAVVDRLTVTLLNEQRLAAKDFHRGPRGRYRVSRDGLKTYFEFYEQQLTKLRHYEGQRLSFRQIFRKQAERLARTIQTDEEYRGYRAAC